MALVWMTHAGLVLPGGAIPVDQAQFDALWSLEGWTLTSSPDGAALPAGIALHFDGLWAPTTQYAKGAVLIAPDGGLIVAYQDQLTDVTFTDTGFTRLPGGGSSGPILAY